MKMWSLNWKINCDDHSSLSVFLLLLFLQVHPKGYFDNYSKNDNNNNNNNNIIIILHVV